MRGNNELMMPRGDISKIPTLFPRRLLPNNQSSTKRSIFFGLKEWFNREDGSLSVLITSLFLLTLVLSFAIIDISGAYLAKRELINMGEAAISRAAHNVDLNRYYSGDRVMAGTNPSTGDPTYLVPVDCQSAERSLVSEVSELSLHGSTVNISNFACEADVLHATLESHIAPTLRIPILNSSIMNDLLTISATLSASNHIGG